MNAPTPDTRHGTLYLVPVSLGEATPWTDFLPQQAQRITAGLRHFVVETARTARAHLKQLDYPHPLRDTDVRELPTEPQTTNATLDALLAPALAGNNVGLMSDAGCPAVADPGARLVARAHALGIQVVPLIGPSSILLGLMGSGLNGQSFCFHGYLPVGEQERDSALRTLEDESRRCGRTQIFIETPYRNERIFDALLKLLKPDTRLCIGCDLGTPEAWLLTHSIRDWRKAARPAIARRPAIYLLLG